MIVKQSLHMPINFPHMHHEYIHPSLQHKFFHNTNTPKIQAKIHPTTSQFYKPPTLSKLHHTQRKNNT